MWLDVPLKAIHLITTQSRGSKLNITHYYVFSLQENQGRISHWGQSTGNCGVEDTHVEQRFCADSGVRNLIITTEP